MTFIYKQLTDSALSQLKQTAKANDWDKVLHDIRDEQQTRMPGPRP